MDDYVGWDLGSDLRLGLEVIVQVIISVIRVKIVYSLFMLPGNIHDKIKKNGS